MSDRRWISGISATTHVDRHGERVSREALEQKAKDISEHGELMYWNHETTLPPIAVITDEWVEKREDGEYQLAFQAYLLQDEDIEFLPQSDIEGLDITRQHVADILDAVTPSPSGHLRISYDLRNFDVREVTPIITEMNELVETQQGFYARKAELPQAVIWVLVAFAGGQIASGFFSRLGEIAAEKAIEKTKNFYARLSEGFAKLFEKAKPEGSQPDVIFGLPIPESDTVVEGALENADRANIGMVLEQLPELYAIALHLLHRNPPNFFSVMRFLYNHETKLWEINYLVTRKTNKVIKGPRYYDPAHPLRARYERALGQMSHPDD